MSKWYPTRLKIISCLVVGPLFGLGLAAEFKADPPGWMIAMLAFLAVPAMVLLALLRKEEAERQSVSVNDQSDTNRDLLYLFRPFRTFKQLVTAIVKFQRIQMAAACGVALITLVFYFFTLAMVSYAVTDSVCKHVIEPIRTSQNMQEFLAHMQEVRKERRRTPFNLARLASSLNRPVPSLLVTVVVVGILAIPMAPLFTLPARAIRNQIVQYQFAKQSERQPLGRWARAIVQREANTPSASDEGQLN